MGGLESFLRHQSDISELRPEVLLKEELSANGALGGEEAVRYQEVRRDFHRCQGTIRGLAI